MRFCHCPPSVLGLILLSALHSAVQAQAPGKDLRLTYASAVNRSEQPYRLYVPTSYDGSRPFPLVLALHGTSGDESTLFDGKSYEQGAIKQAAEKHGVLL